MTLTDALKEWTRWVGKYLMFGLMVVWAIGKTPIGRDDTDAQSWGERSGMMPMTDARTGCQYLSVSGGGITPRLGRDGRQIGCGEVSR